MYDAAYEWLTDQAEEFVAEVGPWVPGVREAFEQAIKDRATELHQRDWLNADTDDETETF